uniref:hypothetical protein n=1 Tax=Pararhizobium sp. IMCC3301 TaxID=3067904 RepID=UPI002741EC2B|nr:hypothetical protein [Pararhizobium sp. IMCC3301]
MPTSVAEIDIWNMALDLLHEAPVSSPVEDTSVRLWFSRNFAQVRDSELRKFAWNFALARAQIAASAQAPAWRWAHKYELPGDCLRMLALRQNGALNGALIAYELEADAILSDAGAPLKLRYIKRVTTTGLWDPLFVDVVVARLAAKLAHWLTGKSSHAEIADRMYQQTLREARRIDALEQFQEDLDQNNVIRVRG